MDHAIQQLERENENLARQREENNFQNQERLKILQIDHQELDHYKTQNQKLQEMIYEIQEKFNEEKETLINEIKNIQENSQKEFKQKL